MGEGGCEGGVRGRGVNVCSLITLLVWCPFAKGAGGRVSGDEGAGGRVNDEGAVGGLGRGGRY